MEINDCMLYLLFGWLILSESFFLGESIAWHGRNGLVELFWVRQTSNELSPATLNHYTCKFLHVCNQTAYSFFLISSFEWYIRCSVNHTSSWKSSRGCLLIFHLCLIWCGNQVSFTACRVTSRRFLALAWSLGMDRSFIHAGSQAGYGVRLRPTNRFAVFISHITTALSPRGPMRFRRTCCGSWLLSRRWGCPLNAHIPI